MFHGLLFCYAERRRVICGSLYTAHEGFYRLLMIHAGHGGDASTFDWCQYATAQKGAGGQRAHAWYRPSREVEVVAQQILERAAFDKVTVKNRGMRNESRWSVIRSHRWTGYRLRKSGSNPDKLPALAPFEVRVSREESALRLAIEATVSGRSWRNLAALRSTRKAPPPQPAGGMGAPDIQFQTQSGDAPIEATTERTRVTRAQCQRDAAASVAAVVAPEQGATVCQRELVFLSCATHFRSCLSQ